MRSEIIAEIEQVQGALERLLVKRERIVFRDLSDEELKEVRESVQEQLKTRKRFLERAGNGKNQQ